MGISCWDCKYRREESNHTNCRAIREHPVFQHLDPGQRGALELMTAATGKFPYSTPDGDPVILFFENEPNYWPTDFDPSDIRHCKFYTLREDIIGFENIPLNKFYPE